MNKSSAILVTSLVLSLLSPTSASIALSDGCATGFAGGDGSISNPYQITTVSEFKELEDCSSTSANFKIMNDIDFGGTEPGTGISSFVGTLDGNGMTLTDVKIDSLSAGSDHHGVFEQINGGSITDLNVEGLDLLEPTDGASYSGFVGGASGNFHLSDLRLSDVQQDSQATGAGGLIGVARLSSTSVVRNIKIETAIKCKTNSSNCGGLIGFVQTLSPNTLVSKVFVETNFVSMGNTTTSNQGGLIGFVNTSISSASSSDLKIQDVVVSLTNASPGAGGRLGGLVGFLQNSIMNTSLELIVDRISVGGVLPEAVDRAALLGGIFETGTGANSIFTANEALLAVDFSAPESNTSLTYGGNLGAAEYDESNAEIYHDTQSTNNTNPVVKVATADKSKLSSYSSRFAITDNLAASGFDWYVQEPDTAGTSNGTAPDGWIGSVFNGYPVPAAVARLGFLGHRINFQKNDGSGEAVTRIAYANNGFGIDVIPNPFTRADHVFNGWSNSSTPGDLFAVGEAINGLDNANIYAQWLELFDVSFDVSSADSGSTASQTDKTSFVVPGQGNLLRDGYEFAGWEDSNGNAYAGGETVNLTSDLVLTAQWTELQSPSPAPYAGPVITSVGAPNDLTAGSGETVTINGQRLGSVSRVTINGFEAEIVSTSSESFQVIIPDGLAAGTYDLKIESSLGNLTYLDGITITETANSTETEAEESSVEYGEMTAWTKRISDTQAKVYVKFPTVGEKVRISHQTGGSGSYETVYVKTTTSETMDGLRIVEGVGTYIVRTINLADINRIRVTVGDQTPVQVRYNR